MALRALSLTFLTYNEFGPHYSDACRVFGLEPTQSGYGLLLCLDDDGRRVTRATEDVAYAQLIASRVGTATLERLEVPATTFPVVRDGWPDDWTERDEAWVTEADASEPATGWGSEVGGYGLDVDGSELTARVRAICGSWPEVTERESHGAPAFFVKKQFVMLWPDGHHDDRFPHLWCAAPPGAQDEMIEMQPDRFFRPPYVGSRGWLGVRLDGAVDWGEVRAVCAEAYRSVAPKRLAALLFEDPRHFEDPSDH